MMNVCKIPDKFEQRDYISGVYDMLDTKGLCCIIKPNEGDIYLKLNEGVDRGRFLLKEGETFDFCGKIYISAVMSAVVSICFYHTL